MKKNPPLLLIILDGFGYSEKTKFNAVFQAKTPNLDTWLAHYPHTLLAASGTAVGLRKGVIGNSEVGHETIGAGRIIPQPDLLLEKAIRDGSFFKNKKLVTNLKKIIPNKTLHIMGLLSDAGVHANQDQMYAFISAAKNEGIQNIVIHPFLDGRDVPPQSAKQYLQQLETFLQKNDIGKIGSIHGRFYAMDRDNNWNRTEKSYRVLTEQQNITYHNWQDALNYYYAQNITDEFIPPTQLDTHAIIQESDGIIFTNFRPDRARQLTQCFVSPTFNHFPVKKMHLACFITPVQYNDTLHTNALLAQPKIRHTLKEILSENNKTIFSIAETEKYAHVTYFFSGGKEEPFAYETRKLIPSIAAKNYVNNPEMSAKKITSAVIDSLQHDPKDFYVINYANADMVGHSGNLEATVKAIECLDRELQKLYDLAITVLHGTMIITADHGNAEDMFDEKIGQPRTAHTTNPVPFLFISEHANKNKQLHLKGLADIAPFILGIMKLPVPKEMK